MTFLNTEILRATARLSYGVGGEELVNVMHLTFVGPASLTDAQALADVGEVLEAYYTDALGFIGTAIQFVDYTIQNISSGAAPLSASWPTLTTGSEVSQALPPQVAALILARTAVSRKQGRVYLMGGTEDDIGGSAWSGAALTILANFAAELFAVQVATNASWRYGVQTLDVIGPPSIINGWDLPVSMSVVAPSRTQRRRSIGIGS